MYACGFSSWWCVKWCWIFEDCLVWNLFLKGTLTPWWSVKMIGIIVQDADLITTLTVVIGTQEHQYRSFTIMKLSWHSTRVWWAPRKFVCKVTSTGNLFTFTKDHEVITNMRSYHTNTYSISKTALFMSKVLAGHTSNPASTLKPGM